VQQHFGEVVAREVIARGDRDGAREVFARFVETVLAQREDAEREARGRVFGIGGECVAQLRLGLLVAAGAHEHVAERRAHVRPAQQLDR
jgi:hypothetical protein